MEVQMTLAILFSTSKDIKERHQHYGALPPPDWFVESSSHPFASRKLKDVTIPNVNTERLVWEIEQPLLGSELQEDVRDRVLEKELLAYKSKPTAPVLIIPPVPLITPCICTSVLATFPANVRSFPFVSMAPSRVKLVLPG